MEIVYKDINSQIIPFEQLTVLSDYTKCFLIDGTTKKEEVYSDSILEDVNYYLDGIQDEQSIIDYYSGVVSLHVVLIDQMEPLGMFFLQRESWYSMEDAIAKGFDPPEIKISL